MEENDKNSENTRDITTIVKDFTETTTDIAIVSSVFIITYIIYAHYCLKEEVKSIIIETGTIIPLILLYSTITVEGVKAMLMRLLEAEARKEGKKEGKTEGEAKRTDEILTILEAKGINKEVIKEIKALPNGNNGKGK